MGARIARVITTTEEPEGEKVEFVEWKTLLPTNSSPSEVTPQQSWSHSPSGRGGPLSKLPPVPSLLQNGGAHPWLQWQFLLLLHTWSGKIQRFKWQLLRNLQVKTNEALPELNTTEQTQMGAECLEILFFRE